MDIGTELLASTTRRRLLCSAASHAHTTATPSLWAQCKPIGIQPGYNDEGEPDSSEDLELANCHCGSTLARRAQVALSESTIREIRKVTKSLTVMVACDVALGTPMAERLSGMSRDEALKILGCTEVKP